jgi:hypothetical protein
MQYLGDLTEDQIVYFRFCTHKSDGTPITMTDTPVVSVYKNDDDTQTTAGITLSQDDDSLTGHHTVKIDTSADAFYATAKDYSVVLTAGKVDSISVVGTVLANFSIENRFIEADVTKIAGSAVTASAGIPEVKVQSMAADTVTASALSAGAVDEIFNEVVAGSFTFRELCEIMASVLAGKTSGGGTSTITFRSVDDLANRVVASVDINGNRLGVVFNL